MIDVRPFNTLGGANHGWLDAKHHFSFASYYDPKRMGWGALRVWNDDTIAADSGFPPHPHADMEIITYVLEPETTRIFQIWIMPDREGGKPSWGAKPFPKDDRSGRFVTLASGIEGDQDALPIRTEARVLGANLKAGESAEYTLGGTRHAYLVPAKGKVEVNGVALDARDGAAIKDVAVLRVTAIEDAEVVMVDVPE
jgi:quercetin 2,3-dioxygenase